MKLKLTEHVWMVIFLLYEQKNKETKQKQTKQNKEKEKAVKFRYLELFHNFFEFSPNCHEKSQFSGSAMLYDAITM